MYGETFITEETRFWLNSNYVGRKSSYVTTRNGKVFLKVTGHL